jgi:hypothetical protein
VRIPIAGGTGYDGSSLIPKLLDPGCKVDVVDLFWFGNHLPRQTGISNKDIFQLNDSNSAAFKVIENGVEIQAMEKAS